jgi:hypothetical protein
MVKIFKRCGEEFKHRLNKPEFTGDKKRGSEPFPKEASLGSDSRINLRMLLVAVFICTHLLAAQGAFAAWSATPIALDPVHEELGETRIIYDGQGGYHVVWNHYITNPAGWGIYAQHVDAAGDPQWEEGGLLVCGGSGYRGSARAVPDGQGGIIVAWDDYNNYEVYAQRINADGELLWDTTGVRVIAATDQYDYCAGMVPDGNGGAIVVSTGRANRVGPDGTLHWGEAGDPPAFATQEVTHVEVVSDGQGGAFVAWRDYASSNIAVQRLGQNPQGGFEARWEEGDPVFLTQNESSTYPQLIRSPDGGTIVIWHTDDSVAGNDLLYAQKIDGDGNPLWDDGKLIASFEETIRYHDLASDGSGGAFITWAEGTGTAPFFAYALYAQRVDESGEPVWTEGDTPTPVRLSAVNNFSYISSQVSYPRKTIENGLGGFITAWYDDDDIVRIQGCDAEGTLLWDAGGISLAQGNNIRLGPTLAANGQGGAVAAWSDYPVDSIENIFIQGINIAGVPGDPGYTDTPPDDDSPLPNNPGSGSGSSGGCFIGAAWATASPVGMHLLMIAVAGIHLLTRRR